MRSPLGNVLRGRPEATKAVALLAPVGKPVAYNHGVLSMDYGLLCGIAV